MIEDARLESAGAAALKRGAWSEAVALLKAEALADPEDAVTQELFGRALWWLDRQDEVIEAREKAIALYLKQGDNLAAARVATLVGFDYLDYRGDWAVSNGWFLRAERLLKELPRSQEHAWHSAYRAVVAVMIEGDIAAARRFQAETAAIAHELHDLDLEMTYIATEGLILVREGKVADGMRNMDEAMTAAIGGEMRDLAVVGNTCCALIYACEAVADYDRATQWCEQVRQFCKRLDLTLLFAICRSYYATVLIWHGAWDEADSELTAAIRDLESSRPSNAQESLAKLGELRRRQGRAEEADAFFARAEPHPMAQLGRAGLALDAGDPDRALDLIFRFRRRINAEDRAEHAFALDIAMRAELQKGDVDAATKSLTELETIASAIGTKPLLATAAAARGAVALASKGHDEAKRHYEDAIDLFDACDAPFDAARARLDYARILRALNRLPIALEQAMLAQATFKRLGAAACAETARALVAEISGDGLPPTRNARPLPGLTAREDEVLRLIAAGRTNLEIAETLVLSVRTVERHISTIYEKLELKGKAARAAAAALAIARTPET